MYTISSNQRQAAKKLQRPFVRLNMIQTLNSVIAQDGSSWAIGGDLDHRAFRQIRSLADTIMVGAQTVRAENIPFPQTHTNTIQPDANTVSSALVGAGGLTAQSSLTVQEPRLVIVTPSFNLPETLRIFKDPSNTKRLTIVTTKEGLERTPSTASFWERLLADGMQPLVFEKKIIFSEVMKFLSKNLGSESVVCEGGPTLNGLLLNENLVDEICMTLALKLAVPKLSLLSAPFTPSIAVGLLAEVSTYLVDSAQSSNELLLRLAVQNG